MCKGNVSLRCEKYFRILLGAVGPVEAEKMAFKVFTGDFSVRNLKKPILPRVRAWEQ